MTRATAVSKGRAAAFTFGGQPRRRVPGATSPASFQEQTKAAGGGQPTKNWEPPEVRVDSWKPTLRATAPIAVELCCGMGVIGIGLRSLGIRVVKAYDSWNAAVAAYNHNAPEAVAVQCDLLAREGYNRVIAECRSLGELALLAAGPPCKGFSQLVNGHHDRQNPNNEVLKAIPEYVASLKPRLVLIENVPDLIRHASGRTLGDLLNRLRVPGPRGLHYRVEYHVYDASLYGTPQARRRIILLAVRDGGEFLPPPGPDLAPLYAALRHGRAVPKELRAYVRVLKDKWDARIVSARQALSDLPRLGPGTDERQRPYRSVPLTAYQRIMRQDAPGLLSDTRTPAVQSETIECQSALNWDPGSARKRDPLYWCRPEAMRGASGRAQRIAGGRFERSIRLCS